MAVWSLTELIAEISRQRDVPERDNYNDASWLWEEGLSKNKSHEIELTPHEEKRINDFIERLLNGEPVQYIVGHSWFYGLKFKVDPSVLIPRPETEELVDWIITDHSKTNKPLKILDIGTGSGCIAIALKKYFGENAEVSAMDISAQALQIAADNAGTNSTLIKFIQRDFLKEGLKELGDFDIIVSNPPYISREYAEDQIIDQLKFEPAIALFPPGSDPDIFYQQMSKILPDHLTSKGVSYFEINEFRETEIKSYFDKTDWLPAETRLDLQGKPRMIKVQTSKIAG